MKKIFSLTFISIFFAVALLAQSTSPGLVIKTLPYSENNIKTRKPLPYQFVREADVMWAKIVWRRIELTEKMNQIFYFPTQPSGGYMSLIDVLLNAIHMKGLNAYKARAKDAGNEFEIPMTEEEIHEAMGAKAVPQVVELEDGSYDTTMVQIPYDPTQIKSFIIKEIWFFDKQRSVMDVRIIGLCPIRTYYRDDDVEQTTPLYKKVFWVFYPEARPFLAKAPVYMPYNDLKALSYDDVFQKRLFSGYIYMISEPQQREIAEYEQGLNVLIRAKQLDNMITDFEQSLWSY